MRRVGSNVCVGNVMFEDLGTWCRLWLYACVTYLTLDAEKFKDLFFLSFLREFENEVSKFS